jgi:hypothetical protein
MNILLPQNQLVHTFLWETQRYLSEQGTDAFFNAFDGVSVSFWKCYDVPMKCKWEFEPDRRAAYFDGIIAGGCAPSLMRIHKGGRLTHVRGSEYTGCYDIVLGSPAIGYQTNTGDLIVSVTLSITPSTTDNICTDMDIYSRVTTPFVAGKVFMMFHTFPIAEAHTYFTRYTQERSVIPYNPWVLGLAANLRNTSPTDSDSAAARAAASAARAEASAESAAASAQKAVVSENNSEKHAQTAMGYVTQTHQDVETTAMSVTEASNFAYTTLGHVSQTKQDLIATAILTAETNKNTTLTFGHVTQTTKDVLATQLSVVEAKKHAQTTLGHVLQTHQDVKETQLSVVEAKKHAKTTLCHVTQTQKDVLETNRSEARSSIYADTALHASDKSAKAAGKSEASAQVLSNAASVSVWFIWLLAICTCLLSFVIYYYYNNRNCHHHV